MVQSGCKGKEEEETEPPSSNEATAPSKPPWRKQKEGTEAPPNAEDEDNTGKDEKKVEDTEAAAADKQPEAGEKQEVEVQPVVEHLQKEPADDQKPAKVEKTGEIDLDYGSSPTSTEEPLEVKQEDEEIFLGGELQDCNQCVGGGHGAGGNIGPNNKQQVKEITEMMQGQRPEIKRRYKQETAGSEDDDKRKEEKDDKSGKNDKSEEAGSHEKKQKSAGKGIGPAAGPGGTMRTTSSPAS